MTLCKPVYDVSLCMNGWRTMRHRGHGLVGLPLTLVGNRDIIRVGIFIAFEV